MDSTIKSWKLVRATWLSRKPSRQAWFVTSWTLVFLFAGCLLYWNNIWNAYEWMPVSRNLVFKQGEWWRLWTALFAHADLGHLLSNALLFFFFGYFLTGYFGFFLFPVTALAFGGLINIFVLLNYEPHIRLIGVSGVVYWMGGLWLTLYFLLDQQRTYLQRILRAGGVALGVFMPSAAFEPQISYRAHFIGFIFGALWGLVYYRWRRKEFKKALVVETVVETNEAPEEVHEFIDKTDEDA